MTTLSNDRSLQQLKTLLFITLFLPSFYGYLGLSIGQILFLFVTLGVYLYMALAHGQRVNLRQAAPVILPMIVLSELYSVSIAVSGMIIDSPSLKDMFDIVRPLIYLTYFLVAMSVMNQTVDIRTLIRFFLWCLLVCTVLDLVKFSQGAMPLMKLYTVFNYMDINYLRFSGTFCFCYNYGFILLFPLAYMMYDKGFRYRWVYIILLSVFVFATGSRSVIAAYFVVLTLFFLFHSMRFSRKIVVLITAAGIFVGAYFLLKDIDHPMIRATLGYVERMVNALVEADQGGGDASLAMRSNQMDYALESFARNPIVGVGPQKEGGEPIEIMLGYYLSSWGILGLGCFFYVMGTLFNLAYRTSQSADKQIASFSRANMLWIVSVFIVGMSTPIIDQVRVANLFYLFQGIQFYLYLQFKQHYE